jgi:hypothetical protein
MDNVGSVCPNVSSLSDISTDQNQFRLVKHKLNSIDFVTRGAKWIIRKLLAAAFYIYCLPCPEMRRDIISEFVASNLQSYGRQY